MKPSSSSADAGWTPDGPLDAAFALSPPSTSGRDVAAAESLAEWGRRAHDARERSLGPLLPRSSVDAGPTPTPRRVVDDDVVSLTRGGASRPPRVVTAESIVACVNAAVASSRSPSPAKRAVATTTNDATIRRGASPLRATARALDFAPTTRAPTPATPRYVEDAETEDEVEDEEDEDEDEDETESPRERARTALLAFLESKWKTRAGRKLSRRALSEWRAIARTRRRDHDVEARAAARRACPPTRDGGVETLDAFDRWRLRAAVRCWRLAGRTRREKSLRIGVHHADAVVWEPVYAKKDATPAPATPASSSTTTTAERFNAWHASVSPAKATAEETTARDASRDPSYGRMDDALARWLAGEESFSSAGETNRRGAAGETNRRGAAGVAAEEATTSMDEPIADLRYYAEALYGGGEGDAGVATEDADFGRDGGGGGGGGEASLRAALMAAEARADELALECKELETDLYAASVLWEETDGENARLREEADAFRAEADNAYQGQRATTYAEPAGFGAPFVTPTRGGFSGCVGYLGHAGYPGHVGPVAYHAPMMTPYHPAMMTPYSPYSHSPPPPPPPPPPAHSGTPRRWRHGPQLRTEVDALERVVEKLQHARDPVHRPVDYPLGVVRLRGSPARVWHGSMIDRNLISTY